ncbi:MAG: hypothetical protein O2887_04610 [Bacteroidetes bacterium]|nr:hypothetical protein [Bacteroidota bacterium]MDA1119765.1 hypothetical protein [Bacteroidota bacterium]
MIEGLPREVNAIFIITSAITFGFIIYYLMQSKELWKDPHKPMSVILILGTWLLIQAVLSFSGFYHNFESSPPRFLFVLAPPIIGIIYLFINKASRAYIMGIPLNVLTYLHVIRIPVEIVLWWLFQNGLIPKLMTFEGRNYDIIAGITAPFIGYFLLSKKTKNRVGVLIWNFFTLGLLLNIVINAIISTPYPFQLQAFDQPNVAIFYFPFIWLPSFIVPIVLFCHLASILIILKKR